MSYITYDELGIVEVRCTICGLPVAQRGYTQFKVNAVPPRMEKVMTVKRLSSWRQKRVHLESGAYMDIIVCSSCINSELDPEVIEKAIEQAWIDTWKFERTKNDKEIKKCLKALPKIKR